MEHIKIIKLIKLIFERSDNDNLTTYVVMETHFCHQKKINML